MIVTSSPFLDAPFRTRILSLPPRIRILLLLLLLSTTIIPLLPTLRRTISPARCAFGVYA